MCSHNVRRRQRVSDYSSSFDARFPLEDESGWIGFLTLPRRPSFSLSFVALGCAERRQLPHLGTK